MRAVRVRDRERALVAFLIEALDDDGYLTQPLDELVDLLVGPEDDIDLREILLEELGIALRHLQNFDPPGIGARNAQECLTLQLLCLDDSAPRKLALAIEVYPDCGADFACTKKRADEDAAEKHSGTLHDKLFVRHWDTWQVGTRAQLGFGLQRPCAIGIAGEIETPLRAQFAANGFAPNELFERAYSAPGSMPRSPCFVGPDAPGEFGERDIELRLHERGAGH